MKLASLLSLAAAPFALLAAAPAIAEDAPGAAGKGPALWKVADEDTTIYLFGTVHILPDGLDWVDPTITNALTGSDTIVTEIRMDAASEAAVQQVTMTKGMLPAGTKLRSLLTAEQKATYEGALTKLGLPEVAADQFDAMKPWMAGLTLSMLPLLQQGYNPNSGVEKVLLGMAGAKPQDALETAEFQIGVFDGLPQESQIAFMIEAAEGIDESKAMLDRMVAEWAEGDADQLAAVMNEGMNDPKIAEALLYNRNATWAEWIDTRLDSPGTVFVAVGAGHLAGAKSVQDYLAEKGIMTQRVK